MNLTHFYHYWRGGAGRQIAAEHNAVLAECGFDGPVFRCPSTGASEAPTINALRNYAEDHDGAILYAHTKGASDNTEFRARWRRSMTERVVLAWRENLARIEAEDLDAIGCHWLTEEKYPGMFGPMTVPAPGSGFFGGNFWIATCDYLRTLPECEAEPRWKAESWIGINSPRAADLLPGWPDDARWPELCV